MHSQWAVRKGSQIYAFHEWIFWRPLWCEKVFKIVQISTKLCRHICLKALKCNNLYTLRIRSIISVDFYFSLSFRYLYILTRSRWIILLLEDTELCIYWMAPRWEIAWRSMFDELWGVRNPCQLLSLSVW